MNLNYHDFHEKLLDSEKPSNYITYLTAVNHWWPEAVAWAKEQGDYELFVESWYTYVLARRKTTELCRPFVEHSGNGSNQYESKGNTRVTLADIGFTKLQWNRRTKELEITLKELDAYFDEWQTNIVVSLPKDENYDTKQT